MMTEENFNVFDAYHSLFLRNFTVTAVVFRLVFTLFRELALKPCMQTTLKMYMKRLATI